jgi:hypothetical protein
MTKFLIFLTAIIISTISTTRGAGIAVFKDQPFHSDASANLIIYKSLIVSSSPFIKLDIGTKQITMQKAKFVEKIDILEVPLNLIKESDLTVIRKSYLDIEAFSKRFPKSVPILKGHIESLRSYIEKFGAGQLRVSGKWITRTEYDAMEKERLEEQARLDRKGGEMAEQARSRRAEVEAFSASQRAKGLEKYGEDWLPREEVSELIKAEAEVSKKSITDCFFQVIQVVKNVSGPGYDGLLIEILDGKTTSDNKRFTYGLEDHHLVLLIGAPKGPAMKHAAPLPDGVYYEKQNLYLSGNYSYISKGTPRTVAAYCTDRESAIKLLRKSYQDK